MAELGGPADTAAVFVPSFSFSSQYSQPAVAGAASALTYHCTHQTISQIDRATPPIVWPSGEVSSTTLVGHSVFAAAEVEHCFQSTELAKEHELRVIQPDEVDLHPCNHFPAIVDVLITLPTPIESLMWKVLFWW